MLLNPLSAGRVGIVAICNVNLILALTISIRYSASRQQFGSSFPIIGNGSPSNELPVLEYQLQQHRLLPFLAGAYAFEFFRHWLSDKFFELEAQIATQNVNEEFLSEMHALASAAKPLAGWMARDGIQTVS
jgi:acyl-CoA oxidase